MVRICHICTVTVMDAHIINDLRGQCSPSNSKPGVSNRIGSKTGKHEVVNKF